MTRLAILRQKGPGEAPYWQRFEVEGTPNMTIAALLDKLNYDDDVFDIDGKPTTRVRWECSCLQGQCGACAMVINGRPALACDTFLRDLKGDEITLAPLTKFPVVADLVVNREAIERGLQEAKMYLEAPEADNSLAADDKPVTNDPSNREESHIAGENASGKPRTAAAHNEKLHDLQYTAARCLKCGLCLEICPNYVHGRQFLGSLLANNAFLLHSQSEERQQELKESFDAHFLIGCSKSLSCEEICPVGISTLASLFFMNRRRTH